MSFKPLGNDVTAAEFLAAAISVFGTTGVVVGIRVYNSWVYNKRLFMDDYLAVFAWVLNVINFGVYIELFLYLEHIATIPIRQFTQFVIAEAFIGGYSIYFAKVPVLVLFARLFGIRNWLRNTVWVTLGVGFAVFLGSLLYVSVECSAAKVQDAVTQGACISSAGTNGLVHGAASLILDIVAFVIPVPIVLKLNVSKSKKIGLCAVFAAGIFAIAASAVALYYKVQTALGNPVSNLGTGSIVLTFVEAGIAIIVSCVPAIRSFWINQLPTFTIYSKIRSLFTSQALTGSASTSSIISKPTGNDAGHSQGTYIELNEANSTHKGHDSRHTPSQY